MAPNTKAELVILSFAFFPHVNPRYPRMTLKYKSLSPSDSMILVRDWVEIILRKEKSLMPPNLKIRYAEWRIISGNPQFFTVDNVRFDKVQVVLGEDTLYWVFYKNMPMYPRVEGRAPLQFSYCPCCLNTHYMKIVDVIRANVPKKLKKLKTAA